MTPYESLVLQIATAAIDRTVRRSIRALKSVEAGLSGEDSGLQNVWEEYCAQVQGEHSIFWAAYQETVADVVAHECTRMTPTEQRAIWLQTDDGASWTLDAAGSATAIPLCSDDVCAYVCQALQAAAADSRNARVEHYNRRKPD